MATHAAVESTPFANRYDAWSCAAAVAAQGAPTCRASSAPRVISPLARPAGRRIIIAYDAADERSHVPTGTGAAERRSHRRPSTSLASCTSSSAKTSGSHAAAAARTCATRAGPALFTRNATSPRPMTRASPRATLCRVGLVVRTQMVS
jgi:hypothetical protein